MPGDVPDRETDRLVDALRDESIGWPERAVIVPKVRPFLHNGEGGGIISPSNAPKIDVAANYTAKAA